MEKSAPSRFPEKRRYLAHLNRSGGQWSTERNQIEGNLLRRAEAECEPPTFTTGEKGVIILVSSLLGPLGLIGGALVVSDACPPELRRAEERYNAFVTGTDI